MALIIIFTWWKTWLWNIIPVSLASLTTLVGGIVDNELWVEVIFYWKHALANLELENIKKNSFSILFVVITILSFPHLWLITYHHNKQLDGTGPAYPSGTTEFTPVVSGVRVAQSFCVMFSWSLFVLLSLFFWSLYRLVLLRFMASNYHYIVCSS